MNKIDSAVSALKKDFTREEIAKMDKKEIKKFAKTKGFAIGTILLAIALIAAIGAAIAIASKSGNQDQGNQQSKIAATSIIDYGAKLKSAHDILMANGASHSKLILSPIANGTNTTASGYYGLFNPISGVAYTPLPATATSAVPMTTMCTDTAADITTTSGVCVTGAVGTASSFGGWQIYNNSNFKSNYAGRANSNTYTMVLRGVPDNTCLAINKTINGANGQVKADIPTGGGVTATAIDITALTTYSINTVATDISGWSEGCISDGTVNYYFNSFGLQ